MRALRNIRVERAIVHEVDPRQKVARLSAAALVLSGSGGFPAYLVAQIERVLADSRAREASFISRQGEVEKWIDQCLGSPADQDFFVDASQNLALRLFDAMAPRTVKEGTLVVILFSAQDHPGHKFLALLKADLSPAFQLVPSTDSHGNLVFEVKEVPESLPNLTYEGGLQKAAVFADSGGEGREIVVVDRQAQAQKAVADFFAVAFLDLRYQRSDVERTHDAHRELPQVLRAITELEEAKDRRKRLQDELRARIELEWLDAVEPVDLVQQISNLPIAEAQKEAAVSYLHSTNIDLRFTPVPAALNRRLKWKIHTGKHGLRLQYPLAYEDTLISRPFNWLKDPKPDPVPITANFIEHQVVVK